MIPEKAPVFSGMNHPCQTDRDINLQIVPEDQITGLRVLSLRWKLLKRIVFIEVIRCKDNIAIPYLINYVEMTCMMKRWQMLKQTMSALTTLKVQHGMYLITTSTP